MKPAWDKLMNKFKDHETILVADVDCTAGGKDLCSTVGVQGYPTIKYGDPNALEKYEGGRTYKDLEKFAGGLKPSCSPANIALCDDEQKAEIEAIQSMDPDALAKEIAEAEADIVAAETLFKSEVDKLQKTYKKLMADKEASIAAIKDGGLGLKKSVQAAAKAAAKAERKAKRAAKRKAKKEKKEL